MILAPVLREARGFTMGPARAVLSGKAAQPWRQDTAPFPRPPAEKQRELARKGSLKNGSMGSPVNQQPKKNNVMARTR